MATIQPMQFPVIFGDNETVFEVTTRLKKMGLRLCSHFTGRLTAERVEAPEPVAVTAWPNGDGITNQPEQEPESPVMSRIQVVKDAWGAKLLCHPDYQFNPRHSNNPDIYGSARKQYLNEIAESAREYREINPAFIRAQRLFAMFQEQA